MKLFVFFDIYSIHMTYGANTSTIPAQEFATKNSNNEAFRKISHIHTHSLTHTHSLSRSLALALSRSRSRALSFARSLVFSLSLSLSEAHPDFFGIAYALIYQTTIKGQITQVIPKYIYEQWTQYRALWDSPIYHGPVTVRAHNFNPFQAIFNLCWYN